VIRRRKMDGDFKGDFSRDSFDIAQIPVGDNTRLLQPFAQLLMQQGRVQLDADWNGNGRSFLYYLRALAKDIIGPVGGRRNAFKIEYISGEDSDFSVGTGHYYVDGILCINAVVDGSGEDIRKIKYTQQQPYNPSMQDIAQLGNGLYLAYLDVWERQVTALEDDTLREVALGQGGPDTVTRAEIVWQVRLLLCSSPTGKPETALEQIVGEIQQAVNNPVVPIEMLEQLKVVLTNFLQSRQRGRLAASLATASTASGPCIVAPDAQYRGEENLLYRVEVHTGSTPTPPQDKSAAAKGAGQRGRKKNAPVSVAQGPTFKWSRENGSVLFAISDAAIEAGKAGDTITVALDNLGRDGSRYTLSKDDWVELVTPDSALSQEPGLMFQVLSVDYNEMHVDLKAKQGFMTVTSSRLLLRRWDYQGGTGPNGLTIAQDGAALITEDKKPLNLENGIQITFSPPDAATDGSAAYRTGDYWLIPARATIGTILWPGGDQPLSLLPQGIAHHYAPLALVTITDKKIVQDNGGPFDLRSTFKCLTELGKE
jgi:hypothetical protein